MELNMRYSEEGFSLMELAVAIGVAAILSGAVVSMSPEFIQEIKLNTEKHSNCSFEKEEAAKQFLEGQEYAGWQGNNAKNSDCKIQRG
jgi:prepilin-type N-terminal cleavage/methylation domain-containing protein